MTFWLGTDEPSWLWRIPVPLMVSRRRLARRKSPCRPALAPWVLDSGGFSELSQYGRWTITPERYAEQANRWQKEAGGLEWAAPMDWMCEPWILERTGLTIREHQLRTVWSLLRLRMIAPGVPWIPVLQGWEPADYRECAAIYLDHSIDLSREPLVAVGTVCRRQGTREADAVLRVCSEYAPNLHAFGYKLQGIVTSAHRLASADSMAWSYDARRGARGPKCTHRGRCSHCSAYALHWRERLLALLRRPRQLEMQWT